MKIGDEVYIHGYIDEIRKDVVIIKNDGGYFGTVPSEIIACEQEPILDKIRAEILDTLYVDSLIFGELIDFRNGKISADDVIEEFNRVTRIEVLKILDKYKSESEG